MYKVGIQPSGSKLRIRDHIRRVGPVDPRRLHRVGLCLRSLDFCSVPCPSELAEPCPLCLIDIGIAESAVDRVEDLDVVDGLGLHGQRPDSRRQRLEDLLVVGQTSRDRHAARYVDLSLELTTGVIQQLIPVLNE